MPELEWGYSYPLFNWVDFFEWRFTLLEIKALKVVIIEYSH
jgi:hypothetical protein